MAYFKTLAVLILVLALGPAAVNLRTSGNFAILAKSGVSTVPSSAVTGDIGLSPASASFITGFGLTLAPGGAFSTSTQVVGQVKAADYASPTPVQLTTAVADMQTAFTDAAGRVSPNFLDLGAGNIGGMTLTPGLYKFNTGVSIPSSVTISGTPLDTWIFQVSGALLQSASTQVILAGGALARNIVWVVTGPVTISASASFKGIILAKTSVTLVTSSSINGRILAQTNVALQKAVVTQSL
ncbi:antifreeze protein [Crassisporium funariophilum]|nr:antifreeze protein [Crassisporium funariophilum]